MLHRTVTVLISLLLLAACTGQRDSGAQPAPDDYQNQQAWRDIQQFLPADMRFDSAHAPKESWWAWHEDNIHLDSFENPAASHRIILLHGVGTNGRQMSLLVGGPMAKLGYETIALDLPGYGMTVPASKATVSYDDWVQLVSDFIDAEKKRDPRPIILYGLSAGGMLTYDVAAKNRNVAGIVGMTFLDQQSQAVRDATARNGFMSRVGGPANSLLGEIPLINRISLPMTLTSRMSMLVNNPQALEVFLADDSSAGNWMSLRFLDSYLNYKRADPAAFTTCPVLLTQPDQDRWTPLELSLPFLQKLEKVAVKTVPLHGAGHYPLEEQGIRELHTAIDSFIKELATPPGQG